MASRYVSGAAALLVLMFVAAGCGGDAEFDPNESEATRTIRLRVEQEMEKQRLQRYGARIANVAAAAGASPSAVLLGPRPGLSADEAPSDGSEEVAASSGPSLSGIDRGEALYAQSCASCHGPRGAGDGPVSSGLDPRPAKHSDGGYMNGLSDGHLVKVIREGGAAVGKSPLMAPWGGVMSDDQIRDVVLFMRSLADPPYPGVTP